MEFWIVYDIATGEELYAGQSTAGSAAHHELSPGTASVLVPQAVVAKRPCDHDALRAWLEVENDNAAERVRSRFATALPLQVGAYIMKEAAAQRWLADPTASTAMLQPEATARGMTLTDLANEVIARYAAWEQVAGLIEGERFDAKVRLSVATTIGALVEAAKIDWTVIDAPAA